MNNNKIPLIEGLTLSRIGDMLCNEFKYNRGELGDLLYCSERTYRRKAQGISRITKDDINNLIIQITKKFCEGKTIEFYSLIKSWFPTLNDYKTDEEVRKVFTANLMGLAANQDTLASSDNDYISTVQFFRSCLDYGFPIESIKLAAQTGWSFFDDVQKRNLLKELLKQKVHIQFIGNPMSTEMRYIVKAMCDPEKELDYRGVNTTLTEWHKYETAYDNMELRVSVNYPILHQSYIVEFADGSEKLLMRDYAYGSPVDLRAPRKLITNQSPDYEYYKTEYEFIWKNGISYDEWKKSTPKVEEILPTGNYILMYPSHAIDNKSNESWIYSDLSIRDNNKVSLKVNIPPNTDDNTALSNYEYSYNGNAQVTGKMIYISLSDNNQEEVINISIPKPLHHGDRYIGVMTALNPSGSAPVAFKCACIERSYFSKIDVDMLYSLICKKNQMYTDTLMVLEPPDIDLFYSSKIFSIQARE